MFGLSSREMDNDVGAANGRAPWRLLLGVGCHYPWQTDAFTQPSQQPRNTRRLALNSARLRQRLR
jgi:hypothetical protein